MLIIEVAALTKYIAGINATIPQTSPVIAIPFPALCESSASPPKIIASAPQMIPVTPKQLVTKAIIPSTIDAIASPLVCFFLLFFGRIRETNY